MLAGGRRTVRYPYKGKNILRKSHHPLLAHLLAYGGMVNSPFFGGCCPERSRLIVAFSDAMTTYSIAVNRMAELAGLKPLPNRYLLRSEMKKTRLIAQAARLALEAHREQHGC
jgi:hypothetical protein